MSNDSGQSANSVSGFGKGPIRTWISSTPTGNKLVLVLYSQIPLAKEKPVSVADEGGGDVVMGAPAGDAVHAASLAFASLYTFLWSMCVVMKSDPDCDFAMSSSPVR